MDNALSTNISTENRNASTLEFPDSVDEPFIPLSKETFEYLTYILNSILSPAVCVFGLVGNLVGIIIARRKCSKVRTQNFQFYIQALFVNNIALCLATIGFLLRYVIENFDFYLANSIDRFIKVASLYLIKVFSHFAVGIIIMMSLERLFSLLRPYTFSQFCLFRHPRRIMGVGFFISGVYLLPLAFCCETWTFTNNENQTVYEIVPRANFRMVFSFFVFFHSIALFFVSPFFIFIINISIPIAYFGYTRRISKSPQENVRRKQQTKITVLTFSIVIFYLLLSIPSLFGLSLSFVDSRYSAIGSFYFIFDFFMSFGLFMTQANCGCDCVIYFLFSTKWLLKLKRVCCKNKKCKQNDLSTVVTPQEAQTEQTDYK